eukprot:XP_001610578.1 3'5'-cyclic nucleotide phosphodiesterase [Babesia bovis T2Bo]
MGFKGPLEFENITNPATFDSTVRVAVERLPSAWSSIKRLYRPICSWNRWYREEVGTCGAFVTQAHAQTFKDPSLERLYALNINDLMLRPFMWSNVAMMTLKSLTWLLIALMVNYSDLEDVVSPMVMYLFHTAVVTSVLVLSLPLAPTLGILTAYTEILCYASYTVLVVLWGCWHHLVQHSMHSFVGESSKMSILQAMSWISLFIFGTGYVMIVALFVHSRMRWAIGVYAVHISTHVLGTIINLIIQPSWIVCLNASLEVFLICCIVAFCYWTACHSELETRLQFLSWTTRYVSNNKGSLIWRSTVQFASAAERLYLGVRECKTLLQDVHTDIQTGGVSNPESIAKLSGALERCIGHLHSGDNLYGLSYGGADVGNEQLEVIDAYLCCSKARFSTQNTIVPQSASTSINLETRPSFPLSLGSIEIASMEVPIFDSIDRNVLLTDWNFDVLEYFKKTPAGFMSIGYTLLQKYQEDYGIDRSVVVNFLYRIENQYRNVPYHNKMHGAMVAQKVLCLASYTGLLEHLSILDEALLMVAALSHDVGHPGRNNAFFVRTHHPVAQLYNDTSVLENYHAASALRVLCTPGCNLFPDCDYDYVRSQIIEHILATDTVDQFHMISQFVLSCKRDDFTFEEYNSRILTSKMLMKAADVAAPTMQWANSLEWVSRLLGEFYAQGAEEVDYCIPISALCDRQHHEQSAKSQAAFLRIVVAPLYEAIASLGSPEIDAIMDQLEENAEKWNEMDKAGTIIACIECEEPKATVDISSLIEPLLPQKQPLNNM